MNQNGLSSEEKKKLDDIIKEEEFRKRFWGTLNKWGHWLFTFIIGIPVLSDVVDRVIAFIKKHG